MGHRPQRQAIRHLLTLLAVVVAAGCSDDDPSVSGASGAPSSAPATSAPPTTAPPGSPVSGGSGLLVLGGAEHRFTVEGCLPEGHPDDPPEAQLRFRLDGRGTSPQGDPFTLSATRFETTGAAATVTETLTVTVEEGAGQRVIEAQRAGVQGAVIDLRDPTASAPLLDVQGATLRAEGRFGPPGATSDTPGLLEGTVEARCP